MSSSVTYTAELGIRRETVLYLSALLRQERRRRRTRRGRRSLGTFAQAVLVLRWFLDGTRVAQLAADNRIGATTACRYLHEGIGVLAVRAPGLREALEAARQAGLTHVSLDGIVVRTDRVSAPGPNGSDAWWSGKHKHHGGNIQVISAPDGWPLWVSGVRPGREHDITCARHHNIIDTLTELRGDLPALADLGYEGEASLLRVPVRKQPGKPLTDDQKTYNSLIRGIRGVGERANALLITRFKALRRVSLDPWQIGKITAAALVLLHHEHDWTISPSHNVIFAY